MGQGAASSFTAIPATLRLDVVSPSVLQTLLRISPPLFPSFTGLFPSRDESEHSIRHHPRVMSGIRKLNYIAVEAIPARLIRNTTIAINSCINPPFRGSGSPL